jgi:hypothetical protein
MISSKSNKYQLYILLLTILLILLIITLINFFSKKTNSPFYIYRSWKNIIRPIKYSSVPSVNTNKTTYNSNDDIIITWTSPVFSKDLEDSENINFVYNIYYIENNLKIYLNTTEWYKTDYDGSSSYTSTLKYIKLYKNIDYKIIMYVKNKDKTKNPKAHSSEPTYSKSFNLQDTDPVVNIDRTGLPNLYKLGSNDIITIKWTVDCNEYDVKLCPGNFKFTVYIYDSNIQEPILTFSGLVPFDNDNDYKIEYYDGNKYTGELGLSNKKIYIFQILQMLPIGEYNIKVVMYTLNKGPNYLYYDYIENMFILID